MSNSGHQPDSVTSAETEQPRTTGHIPPDEYSSSTTSTTSVRTSDFESSSVDTLRASQSVSCDSSTHDSLSTTKSSRQEVARENFDSSQLNSKSPRNDRDRTSHSKPKELLKLTSPEKPSFLPRATYTKRPTRLEPISSRTQSPVLEKHSPNPFTKYSTLKKSSPPVKKGSGRRVSASSKSTGSGVRELASANFHLLGVLGRGANFMSTS